MSITYLMMCPIVPYRTYLLYLYSATFTLCGEEVSVSLGSRYARSREDYGQTRHPPFVRPKNLGKRLMEQTHGVPKEFDVQHWTDMKLP
jgi:hypothetical protein